MLVAVSNQAFCCFYFKYGQKQQLRWSETQMTEGKSISLTKNSQYNLFSCLGRIGKFVMLWEIADKKKKKDALPLIFKNTIYNLNTHIMAFKGQLSNSTFSVNNGGGERKGGIWLGSEVVFSPTWDFGLMLTPLFPSSYTPHVFCVGLISFSLHTYLIFWVQLLYFISVLYWFSPFCGHFSIWNNHF